MTDPKLICYAYQDDTHEYVSVAVADYDPEVPGNILWPRNTTTIVPPAYSGAKIPVFNTTTKKWAVVPDFRGQTGYDPNGNPVLITKSGSPGAFSPPLSTTPPPPLETDPPEPTDGQKNYALRTSKVVFFRRCTEAEAAQFVADLTDASPRLKAIFDSVSYLIPGSEEYPNLRAAIEARVTPERADELLAPSND